MGEKIIVKRKQKPIMEQVTQTSEPDYGFHNDKILLLTDGIKKKIDTRIKKNISSLSEKVEQKLLPRLTEQAKEATKLVKKEMQEKLDFVINKSKLEIASLKETYETEKNHLISENKRIVAKTNTIVEKYNALIKEQNTLKNKSLMFDYLKNPNLSENQKIKLLQQMNGSLTLSHNLFREKLNKSISDNTHASNRIQETQKKETKILPVKENLQATINMPKKSTEVDEIYNALKDIEGME